jgi:Flp pilus assembly protein TadG
MIEFILVLPLLLTILLGAVDWGFYFMVRETVINATREGARVGSVAVDSTAALSDATSAVETYLRNALGADYQRTPAVALTTISGSTAIEVRLQDFPVVPGRPGASITGLGAWTRVPTAVTAETNMRLESP